MYLCLAGVLVGKNRSAQSKTVKRINNTKLDLGTKAEQYRASFVKLNHGRGPELKSSLGKMANNIYRELLRIYMAEDNGAYSTLQKLLNNEIYTPTAVTLSWSAAEGDQI